MNFSRWDDHLKCLERQTNLILNYLFYWFWPILILLISSKLYSGLETPLIVICCLLSVNCFLPANLSQLCYNYNPVQ